MPTTAQTAHCKTLIQHQIDATDRQIGTLAYQLDDLAPEDIALVENSNG